MKHSCLPVLLLACKNVPLADTYIRHSALLALVDCVAQQNLLPCMLELVCRLWGNLVASSSADSILVCPESFVHCTPRPSYLPCAPPNLDRTKAGGKAVPPLKAPMKAIASSRDLEMPCRIAVHYLHSTGCGLRSQRALLTAGGSAYAEACIRAFDSTPSTCL